MFLRMLETSVIRYRERHGSKSILSVEDLSMDSAMIAGDQVPSKIVLQDASKGGIDFSIRNWKLHSQGNIESIRISEDSLKNMIGFEPVIMGVTTCSGAKDFFSDQLSLKH